jgi:hypothetical protein
MSWRFGADQERRRPCSDGQRTVGSEMRRSRFPQFVGLATITVGGLVVALAVGAVVGGLDQGGFQGGLSGLPFGALFLALAAPLLVLGRRVLRRDQSST